MKKGLVIGILCFVAAAVIGAALIVPSLLAPKDPFANTLLALSPELKSFRGDNVRVTASASLGKDLIGILNETPLDLSLEYTVSENREIGYRLTGGAKDDVTDWYLSMNGEGFTTGSDRLLDFDYTLNKDGVRESLKKSVFAPDSGTRYAIPEESFDNLLDFLDPQSENAQDLSVMREAFKRIAEKVKEKTDPVETKEEITLFGETVTATVRTVTLDKVFFLNLIDAVEEETEENPAFLKLVHITSESGEEEETPDLKAVLEELRGSVSDSKITAVLKWAEYKNYFVLFDLVISEEGEKDEIGCRIELTKNPKKDPSLHFELTAEGETVGAMTLDVTGKGKERRTDWKIDFEDNSESETASGAKTVVRTVVTGTAEAYYEGKNGWKSEGNVEITSGYGKNKTESGFTFSFSGTEETGRNCRSVTVDQILLTAKNGEKTEEVLKTETSSFACTVEFSSFPFSSGMKKKPVKDLTALGEEDFDALIVSVPVKFKKACRSLNETLDAELFIDQTNAKVVSALALTGEEELLFIDGKTGRGFMTVSSTPSKLYVFDPETMELIDTLDFKKPISAADADNGILAVGLRNVRTNTELSVYLYDAKTLKQTGELCYGDYAYYPDSYSNHPVSIVVDGTKVIVAACDQHSDIWLIDTETGEHTKYERTVYHAVLVPDRERHVVAMFETGVSTCFLYFMDTRTGKRVGEQIEIGSYLNGGGYFDGKYFHIGEGFFDAAGKQVKKNKLELPRTYISEEPVYLGDELTVILAGTTQGGEKSYFSVLFGPDGVPTEDPLSGMLIDRVRPLGGENRYLMIAYDALSGQPYLLTCEIGKGFALNPKI